MSCIKILLVDDHKLFIEGVGSFLNEKPGLEVVGFAFSAAEYLAMAENVQADVILMDVNMPGMSGFELTQIIKDKKPAAKILALTMYDDVLYVQKMIHSGVNGYMLKSAHIDELVDAIKKVAQGETYLSKDIQRIVFDKIGDMGAHDVFADFNKNKLSKREIEIVSLMAKEYSNQQIAEKLFISVLTVETHRKNIFAKTNAKSIVGLVKYAIREGLVDY